MNAAVNAVSLPPSLVPGGTGVARPISDLTIRRITGSPSVETNAGGNALLLEEYSRRSAWKDVLVGPLAVCGLMVLLSLSLGSVSAAFSLSEVAAGVAVQCAAALAAVCAVLHVARVRGHSLASLGLGVPPLGANILIGVGIGFALFGSGVVGMYLLGHFFDLSNTPPQDFDRLVVGLAAPSLVPLAFLVAVSEEVFFRGFLMTRLRRGTGSWTLAVLLSSALFVACHDLPAAMLPLIALPSVAFSVLTIWRRSLVPAITSHFVLDVVLFVLRQAATQAA